MTLKKIFIKMLPYNITWFGVLVLEIIKVHTFWGVIPLFLSLIFTFWIMYKAYKK
jgi:hypothetical protein